MKILTELQRRKVYQVGAMYAVAGWLLVQVVTQVFPIFEISALVQRIIVLVIVAGFPIALVLAWIFDLTPDGIVRTDDAAVNASHATQQAQRGIDRKLNIVLGALIVLGVGYFVAERVGWLGPARTTASAAGGKSIAVLPFVSMSTDAENGFFSDGLSEEILNSLARIDGMQVVARTSSFQFKGKDEDLREVGRKLGVANVLEGSVRREGERARITAQLIRTADGIHLWSQTYDRTLTDTLAVQLDIAEQVAGALDVVMDDAQRARMAQDGVKNVDAFIAYQKGVKLYDAAHDSSQVRDAIEGLRAANVEFGRATTLEPDFAQAWFMTADLYDHILLADDRAPAERLDAQAQAMRLYGLVAQHSHDPQQRLLALVERQMVSDDWRGLAAQIETALKAPGCRNPDWLPVFASAFGYTDLIENLGRRTTACDPLNRVNFNSRIRAALVAGQGQQALDIRHEYEQTRGGVSARSTGEAEALIVLGRVDEAKAVLASLNSPDETRYKTEAMLAAVTGENAAMLHARLQKMDRSQSIYKFWNNADAVEAALSGDRAESNRQAAAIDALPAGPFQLAVVVADCLCGAPFDLDATPNFKARVAESGLHWPPVAALKLAPRMKAAP